jgi:hypothetical protein
MRISTADLSLRRRAATVAMVLTGMVLGAGCTSSSSSHDDAALDVTTPAGGSSAPSPSAGPSGMSPSGASAWDTSKLPDPCRTLTLNEVTRVLAMSLQPPQRVDSWPPVCAYTLPAAITRFGPQSNPEKPPAAQYFYYLDNSAPTGKEDFERERSNEAAVQPISGLGDTAYWVPAKTEVRVLSGRTSVYTKFSGPTAPPDAKAKAITLARIALPRAKATPH